MPARARLPKTGQQSPIEQHAEWLNLLRPDGPFLTAKILAEALPQGLDVVETKLRGRLRQAWAELQAEPETLCSAWQHLILEELLGYRGQALRQGSMLPRELTGGAGTAPDALLMGPPDPAGGLPGAAERALIYRRPWGEDLTRAKKGLPSPAEQAADLCRRRAVPLALLTNGTMWVLVHARPGMPTSVAVFDADSWSEEPLLLRAFASMLGVRRAAVPAKDSDGKDTDSLVALFTRTADDTTAVTKTLGKQVRAAVELLVAELSRLDREAEGTVLGDVAPRTVYRAALTVMMRIVFLLYAEEQGLLPADDELYADSYSVTKLYDRLDQDDATIADRWQAAWPTLLATFRAIHGGAQHPDMWIPAYGGSLFDPQRFVWMERLKVTDRVVFAMLDALIKLKRRTAAGKVTSTERLSYKGLDVEQIGHVYEGLLEHSAVRLEETHLGLKGKAGVNAKLTDLETWLTAGLLEAETVKLAGLTAKQFTTALAIEPIGAQIGKLDAACDNDPELAARVRPFFGLLQPDLRDEPIVHPAGTVIVQQVGDRRETGTHYTPRVLAEEIVLHTLDPLCFSPGSPDGTPRPADGTQPAEWRVRPASELLALKVLDPAMGSGAFLVSACRYLAERVVEAWGRDGMPSTVIERLGEHHEDRDALLLEARRMIADRCLYGVDIDEMAVELAKLSLWLVTLAKGRPFSFLDHALRSGDSLVGTLSADQISSFHLDPERGHQINARITGTIDELTGPLLSRAAELRREIEEMPVLDIRDARAKAEKLTEAEALTDRLRLAADAVVGAALSVQLLDDSEVESVSGETNGGGNRASTAAAKDKVYDDRLSAISELVERALDGDTAAYDKARALVDSWLKGPRSAPIRPLHWPLDFPEMLGVEGGRSFDAVIGNPPFNGGQKLTGNLGIDYREYLVNKIGNGVRGSADLCAYFLLRNLSLAPGRRTSIIATNTIAQGDTREVGLDQAIAQGWTVYRAVKSQPWPGTAAVQVSLLWIGRAAEDETLVLDETVVRGITPSLDARSRVTGNPHRLVANRGQSFQGSIVLGMGFVLPPERAQELIERDPRNKDVLFPYLNGEDLNSRPDCSASRWVINFHDWPEERARSYPEVFDIVERDVKPVRMTNNRPARRDRWWQYAERAPSLYESIAGLDRVLVVALVSRTVMPAGVSSKQVLSHKLGVFALEGADQLALLSSSIHSSWAWRNSSTMKTDLNYSPSDVYETLPRPESTVGMDAAGRALDTTRSGIMHDRQVGLTKLYNLVHDAAISDSDIQSLRDLHEDVDQAVLAAYDWADLDPGYGFHQTRQGSRYTISPAVQIEILDRLLELNHSRHAQETPRVTVGRNIRATRGGRPTTAGPLIGSDSVAVPPGGPSFPQGSLF
jgi:hypothetical protein